MLIYLLLRLNLKRFLGFKDRDIKGFTLFRSLKEGVYFKEEFTNAEA